MIKSDGMRELHEMDGTRFFFIDGAGSSYTVKGMRQFIFVLLLRY